MITQMIILSHPWALREFYEDRGRGTLMKSRHRIEIEELGMRKIIVVTHDPNTLRGVDVRHIHFMDHHPSEEMLTEAAMRVRRHNGGTISIKGEIRYEFLHN